MPRALPTLAAFVLAAAGAGGAAALAARTVEARSLAAVGAALADEGLDFAKVSVDGLILTLTGTAPDESRRFRALSVAGAQVDPARIRDALAVEAAETLPPPRFGLQVLRNEGEISLIGLVPAGMDRADLAVRVAEATGAQVADLLQSASYDAPEGWDAAVDWTVDALRRLPRSQIGMTARRIEVTAAAGSDGERGMLETALARTLPEGTSLDLSISAPRPVLTPFALIFRIEDGAARFDACSADTDEAARRILAAGRAAGAAGAAECTLGLGVPSPRWGEAAEVAIRTLDDLGGGTLTFSGEAVTLLGAAGTAPAAFDAAVGALEAALPPAFDLEATLPAAPDDAAAGPAEFTATRGPEGLVRMRGRLPDERTRAAVGGSPRPGSARRRSTCARAPPRICPATGASS